MVEYIKRLRNEKVHELMLGKKNEDDPDEGNAHRDGNLRLPKRELIDLIPPIITLDVATASSMVASVNVLASWRENAVLQIEITEPNMDLLLEEPTAESTPAWIPTLEHENMSWVGT